MRLSLFLLKKDFKYTNLKQEEKFIEIKHRRMKMNEFEEVALILLEVAFLVKMVPPLLFLVLRISSERIWRVTNVITTAIAGILLLVVVTLWCFYIFQYRWIIYTGITIGGCIGAYYLIKLEKRGIKKEKSNANGGVT